MPAARTGALYAVFFVSGFCGLIYESIWSHYLKLILGHAAYAQAVVLVVFVGGLALGAWLASRFTERISNPILWYAGIEALVAVVAFVFHPVFLRSSSWALDWLLPVACPADGFCWATWALSALLILPAAVLLGSTFPLMSAGVLRLGVAPGRGLSLLYFLNSAGAALGVLAAGFVLIPRVGLPGTLLIAGAFNAAVALAAWLAVRSGDPRPIPARPRAQPSVADATATRWLLLLAALTGLSSFIYEVVWIRMLTHVLGSATQSFELMLASFILGLALGGAWVRNRIDQVRRPERLLAWVQIAMGVLAVATLPLYIGAFDVMAATLLSTMRNDGGYAIFTTVSAAISMVIMLPATFCAGMTLPLVTAILLARGQGERSIGQVYGINTLGAIVGVLMAVYLLMPTLGMKWSLAVGAVIDVGLGCLLLWHFGRPSGAAPARPAARLSPAVLLATAGVVAAVAIPAAIEFTPKRISSGVFRHALAELKEDAKVMFHRDGRTASIAVIDIAGVRSLRTNGKSDGATDIAGTRVTGDDHTVKLLAALGPAHHPQAKRAAVIGFGTGITSASLLGIGTLESVETIEIEPLVLEAAPFFKPKNSAALSDPRSHIVIDDARAHFARSPRKYDLIVSEPSNPWVSGVSGLFTQEFYVHAAGHLAPGGHFVQWFHLYEASPQLAGSVMRTFASVFRDFRMYATNNYDVILVGRADDGAVELHPDAMELPGMRAALKPLGITSRSQLAAHEVARPSALTLLFDAYGAPPNSDYFPYVDNRAARDRFSAAGAGSIIRLASAPVPMLDYIGPAAPYLGQVRDATREMPSRLHELASAWHGRRLLHGEQLSVAELGYLGAYRNDYFLTRAWLWECRAGVEAQYLLDSVVTVAAEVNNGLPPKDAAALWNEALTGPCRNKLDGRLLAWIALFKAVGGRDAAGTAEAVANVRSQGDPRTALQREYVLLASASVALARNSPDEIRALFAEQIEGVPSERMEMPWFRYLTHLLVLRRTAQSAEPGGKPAPASVPASAASR